MKYKHSGKLASNVREYYLRVYLQWQYARELGEVHPGGNAMAQFRTEAAMRTPAKTQYVPAKFTPLLNTLVPSNENQFGGAGCARHRTTTLATRNFMHG